MTKFRFILAVLTVSLTLAFLAPLGAQAAATDPPGCPGSTMAGPPDVNATCPDGSHPGAVAGPRGGTAPAPGTDYKCDSATTPGLKELLNTAGCNSKNPIFALLQAIINWLFGLIGALAVLAIIVAGIQFITSQGNPDAIKKAKNRISNAVLGLVVLTLMFFILKFIGVAQ